jgi:hypothetical protein
MIRCKRSTNCGAELIDRRGLAQYRRPSQRILNAAGEWQAIHSTAQGCRARTRQWGMRDMPDMPDGANDGTAKCSAGVCVGSTGDSRRDGKVAALVFTCHRASPSERLVHLNSAKHHSRSRGFIHYGHPHSD